MHAHVPVAILGETGHDLARPECVLAHASGLLFAPDWGGDGGVAVIGTDGAVHRIHATSGDPTVPRPLRPNGIALEPGGTFLLAHLGESTGGVFRLHADGEVERVVDSVDGEPLPPTNFVVADASGRLWITVSTRVTPRADDYRAGAASGFVAVASPGEREARIVADGLGYANECVVDAARGALYVNETFGRRLTRFALDPDGRVGERRTLAGFGPGTYPDGLALDVEGALLVTSIVSNRVLRITPDGVVTTVLEDSDAAHLAWTEAAYLADALGRPHLDIAKGRRLKNLSNLAFGGPDMRTAWLGNLLGTTIPRVRLPVAGAEMVHYRAPLGPLASFADDAFTDDVSTDDRFARGAITDGASGGIGSARAGTRGTRDTAAPASRDDALDRASRSNASFQPVPDDPDR